MPCEVHQTLVMTTINTDKKTRFVTLLSAAAARLGRPQPRWVVLLTGGVALAVLVILAIAASQVYDILQAMYAAGLT
jgi:hypothetical protein